MNNKFKKTISVLMLVALAAAYMPSLSAYADRDGKKGERYEHYEKQHDDEREEEEEHEEREYRKEKYSPVAPTNPVNQAPAVPAATNQAAAAFSDNDNVTFSFPSGSGAVQGIIRLQQGKLYIPLDTILKAADVTFVRYPKGNIVEGFANDKQFIFQSDKQVGYFNGQKKNIGGTAFVESNELYVPVQAAAAALGLTVVTNPESATIQFK